MEMLQQCVPLPEVRDQAHRGRQRRCVGMRKPNLWQGIHRKPFMDLAQLCLVLHAVREDSRPSS